MSANTSISYKLSLESKEFLDDLEKAKKKANASAKQMEAGNATETQSVTADTAAVKENTAATEENARAKGGTAQAAASSASAIDAETRAVGANTDAISQSAAEHRKLSEEMGVVTVSQNELANTMKRAKVYAEAQAGELDGLGQGMDSFSRLTQGANQAQTALSQLMSGNVVGAFKSATAAVMSFGKALLANPILAVIAAITAAVAAMAAKWIEAKQRMAEYAAGRGALRDTERELQRAKEGLKTSNETDAELKERGIQAQGRAELAAWDEEFYAKRYAETGDEDYEKKAQDAAQKALAAYRELDEVEEELERRRKARAQRRKDAEDAEARRKADEWRYQHELEEKQKNFEDRKRYDSVEDSAEEEKAGSGKLARLYQMMSDLQDQRSGFNVKERELELDEQIYDLQRQITEEEKRQSDLEAQRINAQAEWMRKRMMENASEEQRLKIIQQEIEALRQMPRTAENEAKMRSLVDQRDAAKKGLEQRQQRVEDWRERRRVGEMSDAEKLEHYNARIAELRQGPRTAETEQQMMAAIDARDAAKKAVEQTEQNKQDFLHRNDTDAQRLRRNSEELKKAMEEGDTGKVLELMSEGEQLAAGHQEPMSKWDIRKAERRAKRDEKAALRAAKAYRRQVAQIERDWATGKISDEDAAKKLAGNSDNPNVRMIVKDGKVTKLEGIETSNSYLKDILEALR